MTEQFPGLTDILDRATDRVDSPALPGRALAVARRRRRVVRTGLVAAAAVAVAGIAVIVVPTGPPDSNQPAAPTSSTPPAEPGVVQESWDPREVDDLPDGAPLFVGLPVDLELPARAASVADRRIDRAVLAVDRGGQIMLLADDGSWRSVPDTARASGTLSPDGSCLAVRSDEDGTLVTWNVTTGVPTPIPMPDGYVASAADSVVWVDNDTLLWDDGAGGWLIDVYSGAASQVRYPASESWTLDPRGRVLESDHPGQLTTWPEGDAVDSPVGGLGRFVASSRLLAGTTTDSRLHDGLVVYAMTRGLDPVAVLPIGDRSADVRPFAVRDDGTVLLTVRAPDPAAGWRIVSWEPTSDELAVVLRLDAAETTNPTAIARDVL